MKKSVSYAVKGVVSDLRTVISIALLLVGSNAMSEEIDQRQAIQLNEGQRAHVLGEMRAMLSGTQAILASLAENDMAEVARQASLLGTHKGHKAEDTVHDVLPQGFMQLGMSVHRAFDQIAADAKLIHKKRTSIQSYVGSIECCDEDMWKLS